MSQNAMPAISPSQYGGRSSAPSTPFVACPPDLYPAVIVDVVDCGYKEHVYQQQSNGYKAFIRLVFQVDAVNPESGKRFTVRTKELPISLNDKANIRAILDTVWGADKVQAWIDAGQPIDLDDLIGQNVSLTVSNWVGRDGLTHDSVEKIGAYSARLGPRLEVENYDRVQDRENWMAPEYSSYGDPPPEQAEFLAQKRAEKNAAKAAEAPTSKAAPAPRTAPLVPKGKAVPAGALGAAATKAKPKFDDGEEDDGDPFGED